MGFRLRKSIQIVPGVRLNFSKTGIGYSAGVRGYRITKRADGRVQRTVSLPGTGLSHVTTTGSGRTATRTRPRPPAARPVQAFAAHPVRPGLFAPHGEKDLYKAVESRDVAAMQAIAHTHPDLVLAASTLAGLLMLATDPAASRPLLAWVFANGTDPATDPFIRTYVTARLSLVVAAGVTVDLGVDRAAVGLALAELHQNAGDLPAAIAVVEQLEPTTYAALSLAELYSLAHRDSDVLALTNAVTNSDDTTALLCVFRAVALRDEGFFDAARDMFKEALKSKQRAAVIRHRALLERARCYEAEGKRALARKDLERIMAEDSTYDGLADALAELATAPKEPT